MNTLRYFTLAFILLAAVNTGKAQWVSIPDDNFGSWLFDNGYSQCMQGNNIVGWQINSQCYEVADTRTIDCSSADVSDLSGIEAFDLDTLICIHNNLIAIDTLPPNLVYFDCSNFSYTPTVTSLPSLPTTLTTLICQGNLLTALPILPDSLDYLDVYQNQLTSLPVLPNELEFLRCAHNQLTILPALPSVLYNMDCSNNPIVTLPGIPSTLEYLICGTCQLNFLPVLPPNLQTLHCFSNNLTALPSLPNSLVFLWCNDNQLTSLPALPPSLGYLWCESNQLATLPAFPSSLIDLRCSLNPLTYMPPFPNSLNVLYCANTTVGTFSKFPDAKMDIIVIPESNIISLPELPDSVGLLGIYNNPISCLPELKKVAKMQIINTNITCLPNYPSGNIWSNPTLNVLPLCNYFNNNGCDVYWNITGKAYEDVNANCISDIGESGLSNIKMELWQNGNLLKQTIPAEGLYSFDVTSYGTYQVTIDTTNIPFRIKCPASGSLTSVISAADSMDYSMDFALECKPGFDLEAKSIGTTGIFRPANFATMEVSAGDASNFYNAHCAAGIGGTVVLNINGPAHFVSPAAGALTPTVNGNIVTWNVTNFGTVNFFEAFDFIVQTDTTAQAGQQVCFVMDVLPAINGDNNPANNSFSICYTVVNSYDPNDKQVYPNGNIDTLQKELTYTIRFQNTGNAEAQHIYITDTLSSHINPASFQLLAYSHQPMVQLDGNKLRFNFPNINLPDSTTNEPASHGYVQFKVKLNNGLPVGTVINNTAFIYFDFNAPVITNTTTNTTYVPAPPAIKPVSIGKYRIDRGVKPNGRL